MRVWEVLLSSVSRDVDVGKVNIDKLIATDIIMNGCGSFPCLISLLAQFLYH